MKIELLDDKTVKVLLSGLDMKDMHLTYDEMDYKSPETRRILLQLLHKVKQQVEIDLTTGKLFIEAFPYADGGCMLFVNLLEPATQKKRCMGFDTPIICELETTQTLGMLCAGLMRYNHIILKSTLYLMNEKYYLVLYTYCKMDAELTKAIREYAVVYGKGAVSLAIVAEHGKPLMDENAMTLLCELLN